MLIKTLMKLIILCIIFSSYVRSDEPSTSQNNVVTIINFGFLLYNSWYILKKLDFLDSDPVSTTTKFIVTAMIYKNIIRPAQTRLRMAADYHVKKNIFPDRYEKLEDEIKNCNPHGGCALILQRLHMESLKRSGSYLLKKGINNEKIAYMRS